MRNLRYPDPLGDTFKRLANQGLWRRWRTLMESRSADALRPSISTEVPLECISGRGRTELTTEDIPLIFLIRNERHLVPSFLAHYRKLGVTRFICTDDASTDGTTDYLLEQPDVDVWTSVLRYKEARRGRAWREALFGIYGHNRWYLNVDSDEYLVYQDCETRNLRSVIRVLEDRQYKRLAAPMLDLYPLDLKEANIEALDRLNPWDIADHFDASGYELRAKKRAPSLRGGPRRREFGEDLELMKYPLIYWDNACHLGASIHQPLPYDRNFIPLMGALLHFKFFSDFEQKASEAVEGGQYYNNSSAYKAALERFQTDGCLQLASVRSTKFTGVEQLLELGFFERVSSRPR